MSQSIGGLYLQLKLETGGIERDLSRVGKVLSAQVNGRQLAREMQQGLAPVIRAYRESARSLSQSTSELAKALEKLGQRVPKAVESATGAATRGAGAARTAAREVEKGARDAERAAKEQAREAEKAAKAVERAAKEQARAAEKAAKDTERAAKEQAREAERAAKEQARAAEKAAKAVERAEKEKAKAAEKAARDAKKAADAVAKAAARQAAADVKAAQQAQKAEERRTAAALRDAKKRQEASARAAAKEAADAQKAAKAAQDAAAKARASRTSMLGALNAGSQELFVGLGAARSGNLFYGLAAFARYFKNVGAAAQGANPYVAGFTLAVVALSAAVVVTYGALAYLTYQLTEMGMQSAISLEMLRAQLVGLIGNAKEAGYEFQWLLDLGKQSIVPTEQIIEADRMLLAYGITVGDTRRKLVRLISDWGSASAASQVQISNFAYALGQFQSTGKLMGQDLRQLQNAFGPGVGRAVQYLADQFDTSFADIKARLAAGTIATDDFFNAIVVGNKQYRKAAKDTAATIAGLQQNIKETFVVGLGEAFLKSGVLEPLRNFLKTIQDFLKNNPYFFKPLADSVRYLFDAISSVGDAVQTNSLDFIVKLFQEWIPNAVVTTARFILYAIEMFKALLPMFQNVWDAFLTLWGVVKVVMPGIGMMVAIVGFVFATLALTWTNILNILSTAFQIAGTAAIAFFLALRGDLQGAKDTLFGIKDIVVEATTTTVDAFKDYFTTLWNLSQIPLMEMPAFNPPEWPDAPKPPGKGSGTVNDLISQEDEEAISKMEDALKRIAELTRRFMGQRSELEEALLGGRTGFTASIDAIYSATKQYVDLVKEALPPGGARSSLIAFLKSEASQLVKLARERDRIARRLEQAQQRLKDIIADRRSFKESIRETIKGFVMNSRLDTEEETLMRRLDSVGSFVQTTITTSKLFVDSMRERLQAVREFVRNIRDLQAKGLNANLVRSFIEAGPDAAADAVKQLAQSDQETIREVNDMQTSLEQLAREFADEQGDIYYDAGQDAAQSLVDSLRGQLQNIRNAAIDIAEAMRAALASLPDDMSAIGRATGTALGQGTTRAWEDYLRNYDWQAAVNRLQPQTTFAGPRRTPDPTPAPTPTPTPTPPPPIPTPTNPIQLPTVQQAVDTILQWLQDVADALMALGNALWPLNFPNLFKMLIGIAPDVKKVVDDVKNFLIQLGAEIRQRGDNLWPDDFSIPGFWDLLLKGMPLAGDAIQNIKTFLSGVAKQIGERASKLWPDNFSPKAIWDVLLRQFPVVSEINRKIKGLLSAAWAYIKEQGARLWPDGFDMKAVWEGLATGFPSVTDGLLKIREWIANLLTRLSKNPGKTFDFMESVWENLLKGLPKFSAIKSAFAQFIESVKVTLSQGLQSILDLWNNATFNFPGFNFSIDVDLPGGKRVSAGLNFAAFSLNTPDIKLADGGLVNRPVMATVGEAGEEAVLPLTNKATMARIADAIGVETGNAETNIDLKVFIGERDITDIVDSRISYRDQASARAVLSGRRI